MPLKTPNYNLQTYGTSDTDVKFLTFRIATAGSQETSNFFIIDKALKDNYDAIIELQNAPKLSIANAQLISPNYYEAGNTDWTEYSPNQSVVFSINQNNIGTVTINVNGLGVRNVMKYDSIGELVNLEDNDWKINHKYLCINVLNYWVWVGATDNYVQTINGVAPDRDGNAVISYMFSASLPASGWSTNKPFTQIVPVEGVRDDMVAIVDVETSSDPDTAVKEISDWGSINKIETNNNEIKAICYVAPPTGDLNLKLKVVI